MKIVYPTTPGYDDDRKISNARFDYRPWAIYYCESAEHVTRALADSRKNGVPVRIRAGGHQHEGMCSGNGVLMIDLSCIHRIDYHQAGHVRIGAGAALRDIYANLWLNGYLFSGGGCGDVHVGGLAQGGGWGPVSRRYGLTCDSLVAVELVDPNGDVKHYSQDGSADDRAVLWGIRGGGGGNFGVITKYCFRLPEKVPAYTDVTLTWGDRELPPEQVDAFVLNWIRKFPGDDDHNLTTFLRWSVVEEPGSPRVVIGGRYIGFEAQARAAMDRMLAGFPRPRQEEYDPSMARIEPVTPGALVDAAQFEQLRRTMGTLKGYQPGPELSAEAGAATETEATAAAQANLGDTCAGVPIRHKVSSGFIRPQFDEEAAVRTLGNFIRGTTSHPDARRYVSFHSLGGAIVKDPLNSSFAFRDRPFLLQFQAWWNPPVPNSMCIAWIANVRESMLPYTDGAFINFIDRDIPLAEYYKGSYQDLKGVKQMCDKYDFFKFEMGIPLP